MFRIGTSAFAAYGARLQTAQRRLPQAHHRAATQAMGHLHRQLVQAADSAGWDPEDSIGIGWTGHQPHITISHSEAGDRVFGHEFGVVNRAPNPLLRNTAQAESDKVNSVYRAHLRNELGI